MIKILRALSGHSQNRSLDEEALASRKNYLFDQVRSPYSVFVNTSTLVPFFWFIFSIKDWKFWFNFYRIDLLRKISLFTEEIL